MTTTERRVLEPADPSVVVASHLRQRIRDCDSLTVDSTSFANLRWNMHERSFRDTEASGGTHLVNTATALTVIGRRPEAFQVDQLEAYDGLNFVNIVGFFDSVHRPRGRWQSREQDEWSPYTTALVVSAIVRNARGPDSSEIISRDFADNTFCYEVGKLVEFLASWSEEDKGDFDHPFFAFTALDALSALAANIHIRDTCREQLVTYEGILVRVLFRFQREFYSQFSFHRGMMPQHLDASNLVLSLCALGQHGRGMAELPDDVLEAGLDTAFELQQPETGQWDTTTPLLGTATGRVGCSTVELAIHLLMITRPVARFERHFREFERLFLALGRGYEPERPLQGWPVDIRRTGSARQTWYSFYVYEFLALFRERTREYAADTVLRHFRYHPEPPKVTWEQIPDYRDFKRRIDRRIIGAGANGENRRPASSLILFGPPGTGKTTIAHALAGALGWGTVEIGPGDFLLNGLDGVFARGDVIFERLMLLEEVVVLFDEVDELVSSREQGSEFFSRILTTYMLPWLQRLRDRGAIVFVFATNNIERFDAAIKRVGRFDLVLPVGPPVGEERIRTLRSRLASSFGPDDERVVAIGEGAPEHATIGDILQAIEQSTAAGRDVDPRDVLARLKLSRLTVTEAEWSRFVEHADSYTEAGSP